MKKHQIHLTDEFERKVITMFSLSTSYQDIHMHIQDFYGVHVSNGTINALTDKLIPELQALYERQLETVHPIVWLDTIHSKIKENGRFISKSVNIILSRNVEVKK